MMRASVRSIGTDHLVERRGIERPEQVAECLEDGDVCRTALAQIEAGPGDDPCSALDRPLVPGREQARLADAGIAADQDGCRVPLRCGLEGRVELGQFGGSADEGRARDPSHGPIISPRGGQHG